MMKRVLVFATMALFTLMLGISYAQDTKQPKKANLCDKLNYQDVKALLGKSFENINSGELRFKEEEKGISYYNLYCEEGEFNWTPSEKEEIPTNVKTSWAFVEKNGEKLAYAKLVQLNLYDIAGPVKGITQSTRVQPRIKMEGGTKVYIWHTKEGITTKMKISNVEAPHKNEGKSTFWWEVKIAQYLDKFRTNK